MRVRLTVGAVALGFAAAVSEAHADEPTKKDCVAANETGQDLRRADNLHEARAVLATCTVARCPRPVREDCAQRLNEIESVMPTLVFAAKGDDGRDLSAVRVTMDGRLLLKSLDGTAVEVDPGEHRFKFESGGMKSEKVVVVREAEKQRHLLVALESTPSSDGSPRPAVRPVTSHGDRRGIFAGPPLRNVALGLGAAGAAGIAMGVVFGVMAKSTYDNAVSTECLGGNTAQCLQSGVEDGSTAHTQAAMATAAFIAGGAFLAGSVLLYLTTPSESLSVGPTVADRTFGFRVKGGF